MSRRRIAPAAAPRMTDPNIPWLQNPRGTPEPPAPHPLLLCSSNSGDTGIPEILRIQTNHVQPRLYLYQSQHCPSHRSSQITPGLGGPGLSWMVPTGFIPGRFRWSQVVLAHPRSRSSQVVPDRPKWSWAVPDLDGPKLSRVIQTILDDPPGSSEISPACPGIVLDHPSLS